MGWPQPDDPGVTDLLSDDRLSAWLYDAREVGWPGELPFYRAIVAETGGGTSGVLDVGCGTGRIALALAADGIRVTGTDASAAMIDVARSRTRGPNPAWMVSDMRRLELDGTFGCVIVGGHAFQFMTTPEDAVKALRAMRARLAADGGIVLHIDNPTTEWLAGLPDLPGEPQPAGAALVHPMTIERWQLASHWSLDRRRRDAIHTGSWRRLGEDDQVLEEIARGPMRLHVFEPREVDRAVRAAGLETAAVYGDFDRSPFTDGSPSMLWLARSAR
jgi:SAM-dependent methyltransferase